MHQFESFSFRVQADKESFFRELPSFSYVENALTFAIKPYVFGVTTVRVIMSDQDHHPWHNEGVSETELKIPNPSFMPIHTI